MSFAAQVTLAWDPNTESDLAGYRVHYGTASNSYSVHIDVHNVTTYTVSNLASGNYFFAVKAYGAIDIVVNNAAILRDAFIFKASRENWDQVIATNLTVPFALLAAATPIEPAWDRMLLVSIPQSNPRPTCATRAWGP